jgi:hypothetical protein
MESSAVRTVKGFLISVGVCSAPLIPVMVFTFMGLSGSPYIRETSVLFADFIRAYGLGLGLLLSFLSNLVTAALILGLTHLVFYRPAVFQDPHHVSLGRKLVAAGIGLFLLVWAQKFFLDGYDDMLVLEDAGIGSSSLLWIVLLASLSAFIIGTAFWLAILFPRVKPTEVGKPDSEGAEESRTIP